MQSLIFHNSYLDFKSIISEGRINTLFQPIISLSDGEILGYEALSRGPKDSEFFSPLALFDAAKKYNMLWDLELVCRHKALENSYGRLNKKKLFINIDPNIIQDSKFKQGFTKGLLEQFNVDPSDIIFEITENTAVSDYKELRDVLDNYSEQGYNIALDDAGSGYSGLVLLAETHPNYLKIDMDLVRNIDISKIKQDLIKTFCDFSKNTNIKLIAEGIETESELKILIDLGIDYGQGYFLERPSGKINIKIESSKLRLINDLSKRSQILKRGMLNDFYIGFLARKDDAIPSNKTINDVNQIFLDKHNLQGIPVISNKRPVGLVMRNKFYYKLMTKDLKGIEDIEISKMMTKLPLIVDYNAPIRKVARMAVSRREEKTYDYVIVTKNNEYYGVVPVLTIIESLSYVE